MLVYVVAASVVASILCFWLLLFGVFGVVSACCRLLLYHVFVVCCVRSAFVVCCWLMWFDVVCCLFVAVVCISLCGAVCG